MPSFWENTLVTKWALLCSTTPMEVNLVWYTHQRLIMFFSASQGTKSQVCFFCNESNSRYIAYSHLSCPHASKYDLGSHVLRIWVIKAMLVNYFLWLWVCRPGEMSPTSMLENSIILIAHRHKRGVSEVPFPSEEGLGDVTVSIGVL